MTRSLPRTRTRWSLACLSVALEQVDPQVDSDANPRPDCARPRFRSRAGPRGRSSSREGSKGWPRARRLTVSADGVGASDRQIELLVPQDFDIGPLKRGRVIAATVDIAQDGGYSLTGVSQDSDATAADDEEGLQGDQAPN